MRIENLLTNNICQSFKPCRPNILFLFRESWKCTNSIKRYTLTTMSGSYSIRKNVMKKYKLTIQSITLQVTFMLQFCSSILVVYISQVTFMLQFCSSILVVYISQCIIIMKRLASFFKAARRRKFVCIIFFLFVVFSWIFSSFSLFCYCL